MERLKFVVLTDRVSFSFEQFASSCCEKHASARMHLSEDLRGVTGLLCHLVWTLILSIELFWLMNEYEMIPVLALGILLRVNQINFHVVNKPGWFLSSFRDSIMYDGKILKLTRRTSITHSAVSVRYQDKRRDNGFRLAFNQAALDQYRRNGTDLYQISSTVEQYQFVA